MYSHGSEYEAYLLMCIANKLKGKATVGYASRTLSYSSVEKLLNELESQYGNIGIADEVHAEMKILQQRAEQSVGDYGLRMQKLHHRLTKIIDCALNLTKWDREARRRYADDDALQQFMFGLLAPLDHQVRSERPRVLNEAIKIALEFEGKQSA